jgi:hypothetical protein
MRRPPQFAGGPARRPSQCGAPAAAHATRWRKADATGNAPAPSGWATTTREIAKSSAPFPVRAPVALALQRAG